MTILSKSLLALGLLLLTHATYSAHEHHTLLTTTLPSPTTPASAPSATAATTLPADILVETLVSTVLLAVALVLGSPGFTPISWREWAGKIERDGGGDNPYLAVERRDGFLDVRARRREFAEWVRGQGEGGGK
ncbi:MAG: hypothetical protein M1839_007433 [Geoglossum umbratile]|nr:MAG: hypothetical protein M1839_007433 [Geoglossum umbratile]